MTERIPNAGPWITEREVRYVADAAANDWYAGAGTALKRFEEAFASYVGVKHAVAVPHCTAALHLGLAGLRIGPGDEVIVPELTWVATASPITYVGAKTIFADVDPKTWCISADSVEKLITPRTKAIIPVDLYGGVPDMARLRELAKAHNLALIEDSAEAIGAEWHGERAGSLGDAGAFSFHGSKTLTTGEGGMFVTDREDMYDRALFLRDHGRPKTSFRFFSTTEVAFKYRMSSLQAAFGLAQLERVEELVQRKRDIFKWYQERLRDVPGVEMNYEPPNTVNGYWMVTVVVAPEYKLTCREMMAKFDEHLIDARPFFHPLSALPAFENMEHAASARQQNVVAHELSPRGINLPSAMLITEAQVDKVCSVMRTFLGRS